MHLPAYAFDKPFSDYYASSMEEEKDVNQLLAPNTILRERYKIIDLIGQGGMGAVYLAEDLRLPGRRTAIKEIALEKVAMGDETLMQQAREQFQREASILAQLDHPSLPKVSDYFEANGHDYLVMDYVPGDDLRVVLERARAEGRFLRERDVLRWVDEIADALIYLHSLPQPVLHRDIKPSNIKLTPSGRIKLVDFGLVKLLALDDTATVTVIQGRGTVAYTPIEQYGGDTGHTDVRSDIYALGATLYHLLTGHLPADAKQRFLKAEALTPPRELNPNISRQVERAILWAMELHPANRPPDVPTFVAALHGRIAPPTHDRREAAPLALSELLAEQAPLAALAGATFLLALWLTALAAG